MNDCNNNGSCNIDGKCECNTGSYGPDCSATVKDISTSGDSYSVTGMRWKYFLLPATADFSIQVEATRNVSVYVRKGLTDIPDSVNFDTVIKKEKSIEVTQKTLDLTAGAIMAIYTMHEPTQVTDYNVKMVMDTEAISFMQ